MICKKNNATNNIKLILLALVGKIGKRKQIVLFCTSICDMSVRIFFFLIIFIMKV